MKAYHGWKHPEDDSSNVMCLYDGGKPLPMYLEELCYSRKFDWGDPDPPLWLRFGAVQLAYALLRDYTGYRSKQARKYYRAFADQVVSSLPSTWTLTEGQIDVFLHRMGPPCALERIAGPDILP
jgi:hypothetical protein